ncbi:hypothetical protein Tco_1177707 [Tanacetum coccineum]
MNISNTFNISDIYEFHSEDEVEYENSSRSSSKVRGNDEDKIEELALLQSIKVQLVTHQAGIYPELSRVRF